MGIGISEQATTGNLSGFWAIVDWHFILYASNQQLEYCLDFKAIGSWEFMWISSNLHLGILSGFLGNLQLGIKHIHLIRISSNWQLGITFMFDSRQSSVGNFIGFGVIGSWEFSWTLRILSGFRVIGIWEFYPEFPGN